MLPYREAFEQENNSRNALFCLCCPPVNFALMEMCCVAEVSICVYQNLVMFLNFLELFVCFYCL